MNDPDLKAAIAASLRESYPSEERGRGKSPSTSKDRRPRDVVDLTGDDDGDDDELLPVFSRSKSVIGSETDEGEGEDLKRSIELPTQGRNGDSDSDSDNDELAPVLPRSDAVVGSETDEGESEDLQLKKAIELSMQENANDGKDAESVKKNTSTVTSTSTGVRETPQPIGILGLDRKQMEEERLARVAKRKAEAANVSLLNHESKIQRTDAAPLSTRTAAGTASHSQKTPSSQVHASEKLEQGRPSVTPGINFPNGVVKKTWAFGNTRVGDDIKIEEVFQKNDLQLAVLSSFLWDMDWLFSKMDLQKTRFILIMQAKEDETVSIRIRARESAFSIQS